MNFDQITDDLFIGGQFEPDEWAMLEEQGVTANLNLQEEREDVFDGSKPEVSVWLPTRDWFGPSVDEIEEGARTVASFIDDGHKVYVHCRHGAGRAPIVGAAYLVTTGMQVDDAYKLVKTQRPGFKPNPTQVANLSLFAMRWAKQKAR